MVCLHYPEEGMGSIKDPATWRGSILTQKGSIYLISFSCHFQYSQEGNRDVYKKRLPCYLLGTLIELVFESYSKDVCQCLLHENPRSRIFHKLYSNHHAFDATEGSQLFHRLPYMPQAIHYYARMPQILSAG